MSKLVIDNHSEYSLSCLKNGTGADTTGTLGVGVVNLIQPFTFPKGVFAVKKILMASGLRPTGKLLATVSRNNLDPLTVSAFGFVLTHTVFLQNQSQSTDVVFEDGEFVLDSEQPLSLYVGCSDQLITSIWTVAVTVWYKNARWT